MPGYDNKTRNIVPISEKLMLTVEEAAAYSNIGINKIHEIVPEMIALELEWGHLD